LRIANCGFPASHGFLQTRRIADLTAKNPEKGHFGGTPKWAGEPPALPMTFSVFALQSASIAHFSEDFPVSVSICVNLWPIPVSVAAGHSVIFAFYVVKESFMSLKPWFFARCAPFCGKSAQVVIHEQLTTNCEVSQSRPIKPNQG
jgi:hypothetical protein